MSSFQNQLDQLAFRFEENNKRDRWFDHPTGWLSVVGNDFGKGIESKEAKKHYLSGLFSGNSSIRRWFSKLDLESHTLLFFSDESNNESQSLTGSIDLSLIESIQESNTNTAFAIDMIALNGSRHTIAAASQSEILSWAFILDKIVKGQKVAAPEPSELPATPTSNADSGSSQDVSPTAEMTDRIDAINRSIVFSGELNVKDIDETTKIPKAKWMYRYAIIASGALYFYETASDLYDEDKDPTGEITLSNVLVVESSSEPQSEGVFDIHARVKTGGNAEGMRIFSIDASSEDNAKRWMMQICQSVGVLDLLPAEGGGYVSVVSEEAVAKRSEKRRLSAMKLAGGLGIFSSALSSALMNVNASNQNESAASHQHAGVTQENDYSGNRNSTGGHNSSGSHANIDSNDPRQQQQFCRSSSFKGTSLVTPGRGGGRGRGRGFTGTPTLQRTNSSQYSNTNDSLQYTASSSSSSSSISTTIRTSQHNIEEDDHNDDSDDDEEGKDEADRHGSHSKHQQSSSHQPHVTQEMMRYDEDRSAARAMRLYTHRPPVIVTGQGRGGSSGRGGRGIERAPSNALYTINKPRTDAAASSSSSTPPLDDIHTPV